MKKYKYDPVCGKQMKDVDVYIEVKKKADGVKKIYQLCCPECHSKFEKDEEKYIKQAEQLEKNAGNRSIL